MAAPARVRVRARRGARSGDGQRTTPRMGGHLDLGRTREVFEASTDFTIGLEEEFAIVDPETPRAAAPLRGPLRRLPGGRPAGRVRGGRADRHSEIEIRSGRGGDASPRRWSASASAGPGCSRSPTDMGLALAAMGTHPWASYLDQRIIDTPHYARLREELRWVAQRNNTWSLHVHVGVRGADRAIAVCDHLRGRPAGAARGVGELAVPRRPRHRPALGAHRDLHPHLPALRGPRAVRRPGRPTRTSSTCWSAPTRSSRRRSCGGAFARTTPSARSSCGSATRRRGARSRSRSPR